MASVIGTIVDSNYNLIGFKVKARACELGQKGTERVTANATIQQLISCRIKTSQIDFSSGRIQLVGNFKLNSVPVEMYAQNGFMPVSNEVEATGRIVDGDKNIGYRLKIGDNREINLKTQQIISVVQLMHPKNFVVRRLTSGESVLVARSGSIDRLPIVADVSKMQKKTVQQPVQQPVQKPVQQPVQQPVQKAETKPVNIATETFKIPEKANLSFYALLGILKQHGGYIVTVTGETYRSAVKAVRKLDDSFEAENKIQIAYPEVMPSMTGANVNLRFNSFGSVNVKFADDAERKVKTKVMREKSVYRAGRLVMRSIGVLCDEKNSGAMRDTLRAAGIFAEKLSNTEEYKAVAKIVNVENPAVLVVIIDNVEAFAGNEFMAPDKIGYTNVAMAVNAYEQVNEAYKKCKKMFDARYRFASSDKEKSFALVHSSLRQYNMDELGYIAAAGINVRNNTFSKFATDDDLAKKKVKQDETEKTPRPMTLNWSVSLTDVAQERKEHDVEEIITQFTDKIRQGEDFAEIANLEDLLAKLKMQIWQMNVALVHGNSSKILQLPADCDGIETNNTTTPKMRTTRSVDIVLSHQAFNSLRLELKNAGDWNVNTVH